MTIPTITSTHSGDTNGFIPIIVTQRQRPLPEGKGQSGDRFQRRGGQRLGLTLLFVRLPIAAGLGNEGVHNSACFQEDFVSGVQKWLWSARGACKADGTVGSLAKFFKLSPGVSQSGVRVEDKPLTLRGDASGV